jgi:hypothetical protein
MVYNTQNYWASGVCPPPGILKIRKHNVICLRFHVMRERPTMFGPLERVKLNYWTQVTSF